MLDNLISHGILSGKMIPIENNPFLQLRFERMNENKLTEKTVSSASRVWLEIDLSVLTNNFEQIRQAVQPLKIMAVLKADAYGLGAEQIAKCLLNAGADGFCVAELREALQLRPLGKPIQILGGLLDFELEDAVKNHFILGITDWQTAKKISDESIRQGVVTEVHFKIDSGMGRLGILADSAVETVKKCCMLPNLNCCGIYSHFPDAAADELSSTQCSRILQIRNDLEKHGIYLTKCHIANSDAINSCRHSTIAPFTHVRTGCDLYGSFNTAGETKLGLKSVISLKTRVVQVREMPAGHTIGYNCTHRLTENTKIATISAGYADGVPLSLSGKGAVIIRGQRCPIVGRISMDYTTVDVNCLTEDIQPGEEVILIGGDRDCQITVAEWATLKNTHPYDILCSFGHRVNRVYIRRQN